MLVACARCITHQSISAAVDPQACVALSESAGYAHYCNGTGIVAWNVQSTACLCCKDANDALTNIELDSISRHRYNIYSRHGGTFISPDSPECDVTDDPNPTSCEDIVVTEPEEETPQGDAVEEAVGEEESGNGDVVLTLTGETCMALKILPSCSDE